MDADGNYNPGIVFCGHCGMPITDTPQYGKEYAHWDSFCPFGGVTMPCEAWLALAKTYACEGAQNELCKALEELIKATKHAARASAIMDDVRNGRRHEEDGRHRKRFRAARKRLSTATAAVAEARAKLAARERARYVWRCHYTLAKTQKKAC